MENTIRTQASVSYDSASLLTGFVIGGLVGFGAMMLFAPQAGLRTRDQIRQKSLALQKRTTDTFTDLAALSHFDHREILSGTRERADKG